MNAIATALSPRARNLSLAALAFLAGSALMTVCVVASSFRVQGLSVILASACAVGTALALAGAFGGEE